MKNLNWYGMWRWLKDGTLLLLSVGALMDFGRWIYSLFTDYEVPAWTAGKALFWMTVVAVFVVAGCFSKLLDRRST